jgi:hypothetical protein
LALAGFFATFFAWLFFFLGAGFFFIRVLETSRARCPDAKGADLPGVRERASGGCGPVH